MIEDATLEPLRARGYELGGFLGSGAFSEVRGRGVFPPLFCWLRSKSKLSLPASAHTAQVFPPLPFYFFLFTFSGHFGDTDLDGGSGGDQEGHRRRGRRRSVCCLETAIGAIAERRRRGRFVIFSPASAAGSSPGARGEGGRGLARAQGPSKRDPAAGRGRAGKEEGREREKRRGVREHGNR